jgi:hypothetical protein
MGYVALTNDRITDWKTVVVLLHSTWARVLVFSGYILKHK